MALVTPAPFPDRLSVAALCDDTPSSTALPSPQSTPSLTTHKQLPSDDTEGLDIQDEDVLIAVRALGDMRSGTGLPQHRPRPLAFEHNIPATEATSYNPTPALSMGSSSSASTTSEAAPSLMEDTEETTFVNRVSALPLVNTALRAYGYTKASSRVVKYGAEMVESSVKTISRPVMDRLPVEQLDEFACRQLDRIDRYRRVSSSQPSRDNEAVRLEEHIVASRGLKRARETWSERDMLMRGESGGFSRENSVGRSGSVTPSEAGFSEGDLSRFGMTSPFADDDDEDEQDTNAKAIVASGGQVVARSKWQAVLLEAGGIGAAVSEESMKRLKYCLQWLQYATTHIDHQILLLRSFIASLNPNNVELNADALVPIQSLQTLTDVKKDLVSTIRQVVDVVSKYAGGSLPEPARATVRTFILKLPERWAQAARADARGNGNGNGNGNASSVVGPVSPFSPSMTSPPTATAATQAAERVLTLATESLDMMRSVTSVFKESLDKAEAWVERLRIVGIQRQSTSADGPSSPKVTESFTSLSIAYDPVRSPTSPESMDEADAPLRKRRATKKGVKGELAEMDVDA